MKPVCYLHIQSQEKEYYQKGKKGESLFIKEFSGDECVSHYEYMSSLPVIGDVLMELKETNNGFPTYQIDHVVYFKYGYLLFITKEHVPDAHDVFKRFAKVFEQTYTRFLDLQKAEAQAKEALIEAALERIRSRSLAMHNSNEIGDVAFVLFQQLKSLGGELWGTGFGFCENNSDVDEYWFANENGVMPQLKIPNTIDPSHKQMYKGWKKNLESLSIIKDGKELKDHYKYMLTVPDVQPIFQGLLDNGIAFPKWQKWHAAYFKYGYLLVITTEIYKNKAVFKRFAKVFEQAYTRFLDLQKAEAQAREAQIEASLERVRSRVMAIQTSNELDEVIQIIFEELGKLDVQLMECSIATYDINPKDLIYRSAGPIGALQPKSVKLQYFDHPLLNDLFKDLENGIKYRSGELSGKILKTWWDSVFTKTDFKNAPKKFIASWKSVKSIFYSQFAIKHGFLEFLGNSPLEKDKVQLLERFTNVIDLTYSRYDDVVKAEYQAREAQIEIALERVRSRSMAMHKSEELKDVVKVIFDQMAHLKINAEHAGIVVDYEPKKDWHFWVADKQDIPAKITVPYLDLVWDKQFTEAKKKGTDFFKTQLDFEEKNSFYKKLLPHIEGLTKEAWDFYLNCPGLAASTAIQKDIGLYIENFSGIPFSNAENSILMRFGKVFQQTYTRFLDLQKAEAQAKEALIEAALERVRSRSMAMHKSEELLEAGALLYHELSDLGIEHLTAGYILFDKKAHIGYSYGVNPADGSIRHQPVELIHTEDKTMKAIVSSWKKQEPLLVIELNPEETIKHQTYIAEKSKNFPLSVAKLLAISPERLVIHCFNFKQGYLLIVGGIRLSEEQQNMIPRFAKVFQQTYTRFLDLQKAEAQAREAKIETALEKVRSRTMAMQKGEEVKEVVVLLYKELIALGVTNFATCGYVEINEETQLQSTWVTSPGGDSLGLFYLPLTGDVYFDERFKAWKKQQTVFHQTVAGKERRKHLEYAITTFNSKEAEEMVLNQFPDPTVFYCFNFSHGYLHLVAGSQLTKEEEALLARFTKVFEQTYARFLDLEKAAAQTREAQINLAVERVRAKALAMHKSEEIMEVVAKLKEEVMALDIPDVIAATIFLNEGDDKVRMWDLSTLEKDNNGYQIPFDITFQLKKRDPDLYVKRIWENPENYFIEVQEGKDFKRIIAWLRENNKDEIADEVKAYTEATKLERLHHAVKKLNNGKLVIDLLNPPSDEMETILTKMGGAFDLAYKRFQDLQKAEAQTREAQIETALERVRSRSMAMHNSEELLEVITVVSEQLQELDFKFVHVSFANNDNSEGYKFWTAAKGLSRPMRFTTPYLDIAVFNNLRAAQEKSDSFCTDVITKKEHNKWHSHLLKHGGSKTMRL